MFKKISNNLILFGIVAISFVLTNNAFAASDVNYAFSGQSTGGVLGGRNYNDDYFNNNPYLYNIGNTNYAAPKLNEVALLTNKNNTNTANQTPTVINNYYYNTSAPTTGSTAKTTTSSTTKTVATSASNQAVAPASGTRVASASTSGYGRYDSVPLAKEVGTGRSVVNSPYSNNLGASAYGATGYSTSSFLPTTFLGWFLLALLVAGIVVVYRLIVRRKRAAAAVVTVKA
jgi:hypothetical protein